MSRAKAASTSWKDHTLVVVLICGAAVATFMATVVFPIMTTIQGQRLAKALEDRQVAQENAERLRSSLTEASSSLKIASQHMRRTSIELASLRLGAMFEASSPLPYGWRRISFGATRADVEEKYSDRKIEDNGEYLSIDGDNTPFGQAIFYFNKEEKVKYVSFSGNPPAFSGLQKWS
jgi:hypothetical protein